MKTRFEFSAKKYFGNYESRSKDRSHFLNQYNHRLKIDLWLQIKIGPFLEIF